MFMMNKKIKLKGMTRVPKKIKKRVYLDYGILIPYLFLSVLGIIMVYSASSTHLASKGLNPADYAIKQALFFIVGIIAILFIYKLKTDVFKSYKLIKFSVAIMILILLLTKFTPLGVHGGGADGWISIAGITIQPVEFLKIVQIWYLAYVFSSRQDSIQTDLKGVIKMPFLVVGGMILSVLIQPDTGGAVILILLAFIMFLASGINYYYTILGIGIGTIASIGLIQFIAVFGEKLFPARLQYVYQRFRTFSDPFVDSLGDGHQMVNSYYAMKNGGWFGLGIGNSIQKKGFLTAAHTDFMFSIVIEELGIILAIGILGVLMFMILRIFLVGIKSKNSFNSMLCIGIAGLLLIQTFVNVGGITGIIPLTGVTFPFLSQGGSSLITLSVGVGLALNISADERKMRYTQQLEESRRLQEEAEKQKEKEAQDDLYEGYRDLN